MAVGDLGLLALVLELTGELGERLGVVDLLGRARRSCSRSAVTADSSPVTRRAGVGVVPEVGAGGLGLELRPPGLELVDAQVLVGLVEPDAQRLQIVGEVAHGRESASRGTS